MGSFKLRMHKNPFSAGAPPRTPLGELTTLPQTPSRLGRGHPLPIPLPLDAFGVSISLPSPLILKEIYANENDSGMRHRLVVGGALQDY